MLTAKRSRQPVDDNSSAAIDKSMMPSWLPEACVPRVDSPVLHGLSKWADPRNLQVSHIAETLQPGDTVGDFQIVARLGEGAFATIFLAEQKSLGRQVALKISATRCSEAQLLASLEHEHIVRVFSQSVDNDRGWQLLCMQYVPGTSLADLISTLSSSSESDWTGQDALLAVNERMVVPLPLRSESARRKAIPPTATRAESVCLWGIQLAAALTHAHHRGVLHRDIKPANILIDAFGSAYLADFNLSFRSEDREETSKELFGGSVAYMSPEHLDAFNPGNPTDQRAVDARSDIFSLGIVLLELATGKRLWRTQGRDLRDPDVLRRLAEERRTDTSLLDELCSDIPAVLENVFRRCLAPDPTQRFQSALELTKALRGAFEILQMQRRLPVQKYGQILRQHPFVVLFTLLLLPQLIGSATNIAYNAIYIVNRLSPVQHRLFLSLVVTYNILMYGAATSFIIANTVPAGRAWRRKESAALWSSGEMDRMRRTVLNWPRWSIWLTSAAWLPGAIIFPSWISWNSEPLPFSTFFHFGVSFGVSGLISLTYTFLGVQFVVLELLYPWLWIENWSPHQTARHELNGVSSRLRHFQLLAGTVPLTAAIMLLASTPEKLDTDSRLLIGALIIAGNIGFAISLMVAARLQRLVSDLIHPSSATVKSHLMNSD